MNVHEWPLVFFTVLSQMSVGAFVVLGVIQVLGRRRFGTEAIDRVADPALYAIGPLMVAALLASVFHLGNPFNAPNALRHLATSWLSREILFGAAFAGLGFAFALLQWTRWASATVRQVLAAITAIEGLVFVWVTSQVYMLPTVPSWNRWTTPAQFFFTTMVLGTLAIGAALAAAPTLEKFPRLERLLAGRGKQNRAAQSEQVRSLVAVSLRWIGVAALLELVLGLVISIFAFVPAASPNPPETAFSTPLFVTHLVLLVLGAGLLALYLSTVAGGVAAAKVVAGRAVLSRLVWLAGAALLLTLLAQLLSRFMFYGMMDRIGI